MNIIVVSPKSNKNWIESISWSFGDKIRKDIKNTSHRLVANINKEEVNRKNIQCILRNEITDDTILIFYGHGTDSTLIGHNGDIIIDINNASLLQHLHVYVVSCRSINILGRICIENGTKTFIGYKGQYLVFESTLGQVPKGLEETANAGIRYFLTVSNYIVEDIYHSIINEYDKWIDYYTSPYLVLLQEPVNGNIKVLENIIDSMTDGFYNAAVLAINRKLLDYLPK